MKLFALIGIIVVNIAFAADEPTVPNANLNAAFKNGPEPLKRLIGSHLEAFPNSFPHANIIYMPYLDHKIWQQHELVRKLMANPKYREDMAKRGPMLDITIEATKDYEVMAKVFDRSALDRFQDEMKNIVRDVGPEKVFKKLAKFISETYPDYRRRSRDSWFYADSYSNRPFDVAVVASVMFYGLTHKNTTLDPIKEKIQLEEGHIDYLQESELWHAALTNATERMDEKYRADFMKTATEILERWARRLRNAGYNSGPQKLTVKAGEAIHLYEVHPDLATLRGFVGNDCSTDVSFGFPYSPMERVYYVANANNEFLGYVSLSLVNFHDEPSFFFHTIAGPKIDHAMNDLIIRGVYAVREKIGGKNMVMPEKHRIGENINFSPIEEMMMKYAMQSRPEPVKWLDREYRYVIFDTGSSAFYDDPERNGMGHPIQAEVGDLKVEVKEKPFTSPYGLLKIEDCAAKVAAH